MTLEVLYLVAGVAFVFLVVIVWVAQRRSRIPQNWMLIDGSNVMYWDGQTPKLKTVLEAVNLLTAKGYTPGVMFDANAGYLLSGVYKHDHDFARMLGLPSKQVMVADKGVPADPYLLTAARKLEAKVVTNDLFRDWAKDFPEVRKRGQLVRGGYLNGTLWLDFDGSRARANKMGAHKQRRRKKS